MVARIVQTSSREVSRCAHASLPLDDRVGPSSLPMNDPDLGRVLVDADELQQRVSQLGKEITSDFAEEPPLLVGALDLTQVPRPLDGVLAHV